MPKATLAGGNLNIIEDCFVIIPNGQESVKIELKALPDITDSKSASYHDEPIIGRSTPLKTYSHSENRVISFTMHFYTVSDGDIEENLKFLKAIQSAAYPRMGTTTPFLPPPICRIKCGDLLAKEELCVVLISYGTTYPTDVVWDEKTLLPYKFDVQTTWQVVYPSSDLPGQERIIRLGR